MMKLVLKVELGDDKIKQKAIKSISGLSGLESISVDMKDKKMIVIGDIDPIRVVSKLRKVCHAEILSVGPAQSQGPYQPKIYDVFLSFRGEDTRASFTSHLYNSLQSAGIHTFMDDDEIQRGDQVSDSLPQAIRKSRIAIIVLSRNYANSKWCMKELGDIMECHRMMDLVVVPVFYGVDPSEVRHQTGKFGDAFEDLTREISVGFHDQRIWRATLREVSGIAGFVIINSRLFSFCQKTDTLI